MVFKSRPPYQMEYSLKLTKYTLERSRQFLVSYVHVCIFQVFDGIECEWPFLFIYLALDGNYVLK